MKYLILFLALIASYKSHGQTILNGLIKSSSTGQPLEGASIVIIGTNISTKTDEEGKFSVTVEQPSGTIGISYIGYNPKNEPFDLTSDRIYIITLDPQSNMVDEVQVIGYGQTTRRYNTGSVSTVSAKEIEQQPVTNVLSALSGRMAGVFVQTTNGLPGGNINIQIRGTGSITAGTQPLYIIDGVPFDGTAINQNHLLANDNIVGALSPLNSLNPNDIESISILKDADATAIFGSRGSNGVVLITTKKGQSGTTKINFDIQQGINQVAAYPNLLNLDEYLQIRKEAFANDARTPSSDPMDFANYAPDLTLWSQTESTDWARYLFGNTANLSNFQGSISGGNANSTFSLSANYRKEGTIMLGNSNYNRYGLRAQMHHSSTDDKFTVNFSGAYNADNSQMSNPTNGLFFSLLLSPNYPLINPDGSYNWYAGANPLAQSYSSSNSNTSNLIGNLILNYRLISGLNIKTSLGYNKMTVDQIQMFPTKSLNVGGINYTNFGNQSNQSIIIEPQIDYLKDFQSAKLQVLLGSTYQNRIFENQFIRASDFSNESLMENLSSAGNVGPLSNQFTEYRYLSLFGRATYTLLDRYIINATIRRDGSSRFSPDKRFGTFASIGGAWLFSEENGIQNLMPFLSFGKLRASYGTTGNDQITDYQYLATYRSIFNYQDQSTLQPERILNPENFHWETTKKLEFAIELGFINDRLLINAGYYQNQSNDQLVNYDLPRITGFNSYQANLPAVVRNTGWEFEINSRNTESQTFLWQTSFNLTLPKNRLMSFNNFENSSYVNTLEIGYDITRITGRQFLGINEETGIPQFADRDGELSTVPYQFHTRGKRTPDWFGGIGNHFTFRNFQLDVFGQFSKHDAIGGFIYTPGVFVYNNYSMVLERWQQPGDETNIPKSSTSTAYNANYIGSSANTFNVTYFRVKNISLSYSLPNAISSRLKSSQFRIYFDAQNPFTFWDKRIPLLDPESGAITSASNRNIPPIKTYVIGLQVTF